MLRPLEIEITDDGQVQTIRFPFNAALDGRGHAIGAQFRQRLANHIGNRFAIPLTADVGRQRHEGVEFDDGNLDALRQ